MTRPGLFPNGNPRPDYEPPAIECDTRDPRRMPIEALNALGHVKRPLTEVIRENCIECVGGSTADVARCSIEWCPFWPYRMNANPFHRRDASEASREASSARLAQLNAKRAAQKKHDT